jgi:hypothetical protein
MFSLESFKNFIKHTIFTPSAHAGINGMPGCQTLSAGRAACSRFRNVQDGIHDLKAVMSNIASLSRKAVRNALVLFFGYLYGANKTHEEYFCSQC